jgi:trigger factor
MPTALKTTVTDLPESRVRVDVEVPGDELHRAVEAAAREIGRDLKLAGFRKGKIPAPVVIGRLGREAVVEEAVRERIGRWYSAAVDVSRIAPVGDPDLSLGELPDEGAPYAFSFEIGVRPVAKIGDWRGIEAPRREAAAPEERIDAELDAARDRLARLEAVDRPAASGDYVVIDYSGTVDGEPIEGGAARAQLVELGADRLIPGFEEGLLGASAGDERTLELRFPDGYGAPELAGRDAHFEVTVGEVRAKVLPELDDDFALDAAGFDTLAELRDDVRARLLEADERTVEREFREAVLDAAAAAATVTVPEPLIEARASEAWERRVHALSHQGVSKDAYLQLSGMSEEEVLASAREPAERALRQEAVIAAIVAAEAIEPTDDELIETLSSTIAPDERGRTPNPAKLLAQLRKSGRLEELRADVAQQQALERLVEAAVPISPERAAAREKLWTPGSSKD